MLSRLIALLDRHFVTRVGTTIALVAGTLVIYQRLNAALAPRFDFWVPLDGLIPFLPWTWLVYASFYVMLPLAAWWAKPGERTRRTKRESREAGKDVRRARSA